jgi:hypothetical protein
MRLRRSTGGLRSSQAAGIVQSLGTVFRNRPTKNSGAGRSCCSRDIRSQLSVPAVRCGAIIVCSICGTTEVVPFQSNLGLGTVLRTTRHCLCSLGNETADPPTNAALSKPISGRGFRPSPGLLASLLAFQGLHYRLPWAILCAPPGAAARQRENPMCIINRRADEQRIAEWMQTHNTNVFEDYCSGLFAALGRFFIAPCTKRWIDEGLGCCSPGPEP